MWAVTDTDSPAELTLRFDLALQPTYLVFEFMGALDTVQARSFWSRLGFREVTPPLRGKVPAETFRKSVPQAEFSGYHAATLALSPAQTASWIALSGHHGRLSDACVVTDHDGDWSRHYNEQEDVGFFNHHFHEHEWKGLGTHHKSLFLYSTGSVPPSFRHEEQFGAPFAPNRFCRGLILSACNTLAYRATRKWLHTTFPEAVVFGFMSTTRFGTHNICPIMGHWSQKMRGVFQDEPDFWRDPMSWLAGQGRPLDEEMERVIISLNNKYRKLAHRGRDMAMLVGDSVYYEVKKKTVRKLKYDFEFA